MKKNLNTIVSYGAIIASAILLAINYHIFIIENNFAPAGLNGIATMVQYKTGFSISYSSLIINVPLCILSYFLIGKDFAFKNLAFTFAYSFSYLYMQGFDLSYFKYDAQGHDTIFPVIISGILSGWVYGICFKHNCTSGGMAIISKYISKVKPNINFFYITFALNAVVAVISLFVYTDGSSVSYKPVVLCIAYVFITNFVGNYMIKGTKTAYKFTVITTHPDEITNEITHILKHGATKVSAVGGYTGDEKTVLICVVNKHQLVDFRKIIDKYDNTFSFYEQVNETYGNFKKIKSRLA